MYQYSSPIPDPVRRLRCAPWTLAAEPFQMSPRTWYVSGQKWVSSYLIDTSDGLILIDCGIFESLYLLVESISRAGFRLRDIKKILISHAHFDHCGAAAALKHLTGADIYMSREDADFMAHCPDEVFFPMEGCIQHTFYPNHFYHDCEPIRQGDVTIHTLLTPGHTPGCTSFFWSETSGAGKEWKIGMHGGVGPNTMSDAYYKTSRGMTAALRTRYISDMEKLKERPVDISLPSHPNQIEIFDRAGRYSTEPDCYVDSTIWPQFIARHQEQAMRLERGFAR